jgi:hypothetical protein
MKNELIITIVLFCMIVFPAKAQSSAGVKADVNISGLMISQSVNLKSSMKAGGSAGFFYKYTFREIRAVEADLMFHYRTSKMTNQTTGETADYRYFGIELPLYSLLQADIDNRKLYFGLGPLVSFGLFSHNETDTRRINLYKKDTASGRAAVRRWDFGIGFIIGYEMECNLQINFNFQMGLRNMLDDSFENVTMISGLVSLGVGYRF